MNLKFFTVNIAAFLLVYPTWSAQEQGSSHLCSKDFQPSFNEFKLELLRIERESIQGFISKWTKILDDENCRKREPIEIHRKRSQNAIAVAYMEDVLKILQKAVGCRSIPDDLAKECEELCLRAAIERIW